MTAVVEGDYVEERLKSVGNFVLIFWGSSYERLNSGGIGRRFGNFVRHIAMWYEFPLTKPDYVRCKSLPVKISVGRQALKVTKTIGAAYVERKGESVIGRNPQQMRVIEVEGSDTLADCTPNTVIKNVLKSSTRTWGWLWWCAKEITPSRLAEYENNCLLYQQ